MRLAAGREETGAGPIRAAVVGGRGRGGEAEASPAGRAPKPSAAAAGRLREGTLCWREDLTSRRPQPLVLGVRMPTTDLTGGAAGSDPGKTSRLPCRRAHKTRNHFAHTM